MQHFMGVHIWFSEENSFEKLKVVVDTMIYDKVNRVSFAACGKEFSDHKIGQRVREAPHHVREGFSLANRIADRIVRAISIFWFFTTFFGWVSCFTIICYTLIILL